jgi:hypothetical protein
MLRVSSDGVEYRDQELWKNGASAAPGERGRSSSEQGRCRDAACHHLLIVIGDSHTAKLGSWNARRDERTA